MTLLSTFIRESDADRAPGLTRKHENDIYMTVQYIFMNSMTQAVGPRHHRKGERNTRPLYLCRLMKGFGNHGAQNINIRG